MLGAALLGEFTEASTRDIVLDRDPTVYPTIMRWLSGVSPSSLSSKADRPAVRSAADRLVPAAHDDEGGPSDAA